MIVGTAGHIDHGKSALVAALTGRTMDRLAEEQRRGITIDLGFAPLDLGDGTVAGVVDVPGHEDFVRTMVAGSSGVDLALLVIAADEGIMPQTLEHLLVLEQLAIPHGIPVITKIDLVEPDWLELVIGDVSERLARSSVAFAPATAASARTGSGIDALRQQIRAQLGSSRRRRTKDLLRLPIDRAFSVPGIGTVVTGTCWSGTVAAGDEVVLLPGPRMARVRSTESHGRSTAIEAGSRAALGLAGVERTAVQRGDVAVTPDAGWEAATAIDVRLALDPSAPRAIVRRQRVRLHLGTGEWIGWATPRVPIDPGGEALARIVLDEPIVARGGDRFVLRSFSPVRTIGGGEVLDPAPPARGAAWPPDLASTDPALRLRALIARRRHGALATALPVLLGLPAARCAQVAAADGALTQLGGNWVARATIEAASARGVLLVRDFHRAHAAERGMPLETVRAALRAPNWLVAGALEPLLASGRLVSADGLIRNRDFRATGAGGEQEVEHVVAALRSAALTPPTVAELAAQLGRPDVGTTLRMAATAGRVEAVERDRYYARETLEAFVRVLAELGAQGEIGVPALRDRLGVTRKYLIPLLEWADERGVTVRTADARRFRPDAPWLKTVKG